ncbi:DNA cytosine methyltransferase [Streptomyces sp. Act-28]
MAVQAVFGGRPAWVADNDPGACRILAHHLPDVMNLGDITRVDWDEVEPVDILCGGYPCQPFSLAGKRKGTADERHIWPYIADALRVLRPRIAVFENVANHLRLGFADVLADLARLGFDAEWCLVRASEVGAPHDRRRLFLLVWPADAQGPRLPGAGVRGRVAERGGPAADADHLEGDRSRTCLPGRDEPAPYGLAAADTRSGGLAGHRELPTQWNAVQRRVRDDAHGRQPTSPADAARLRRGKGRTEPARFEGGPGTALRGGAPAAGGGGRGPAEPHLQPGQPDAAWGRFLPAVRRWETVLGRPAPWATDDRGRLSPTFVEWLMGLPAGHVTDVPDLSRAQQLKALGNGVVPQQAEAALRLLASRAAPGPGTPSTSSRRTHGIAA